MSEEIVWNDRFSLGVDVIDNAHKKLFTIVRRLTLFEEDEEKKRWACSEAVKYFRSYAVKHFAQEEAYMRSISYGGYEMHKKLHEDLRDRMLPACEKELDISGYSDRAVQRFTGFAIGWLSGHIMTEDHAITKEGTGLYIPHQPDYEKKVLEAEITRSMREIFGLETKVASMSYNAKKFGEGAYYSLAYYSDQEERLLVSFLIDRHLLLYTLRQLPGIAGNEIDQAALSATRQIAKHIVRRTGKYFKDMGLFRFRKDYMMTREEFFRKVDMETPYCCMLFETEQGPFAFCVNK